MAALARARAAENQNGLRKVHGARHLLVLRVRLRRLGTTEKVETAIDSKPSPSSRIAATVPQESGRFKAELEWAKRECGRLGETSPGEAAAAPATVRGSLDCRNATETCPGRTYGFGKAAVGITASQETCRHANSRNVLGGVSQEQRLGCGSLAAVPDATSPARNRFLP
ncbi:MAG: hypothetical protein Kilf2KO_12960 [Rhodospirillales bacterium]